jgi:hypothetical protein
MAFAALAAGGGEMAAGGLFGASEGKAALNFAGTMAPGGHTVNSALQQGTNMTPLVGMKAHSYDVADRGAQS